MQNHHHEDRVERAELGWINNPSAPYSESELEFFIAEDREIRQAALDDILDQLDTGEEDSHV